MLRACYRIWLVAATLLRGKKISSPLKLSGQSKNGSTNPNNTHIDHQEYELARRALIHMTNQKTDAMLAALSETIDKERQKLGVSVRNPAMMKSVEGDINLGMDSFEVKPPMDHNRIMSMAQKGADISYISRQLKLPEDEVTMVLRLKVA